MYDLIPTYGNFTLKGKIVSLHNEDSLISGETKITEWKRLEFGIEINKYSVIYVSLFGFKSEELKIFHRKKRVDKTEQDVVQWDKRFEIDSKKYRLPNEVEINLDPSLVKESETLISWDAIEYILENVSENSKVLINGRMETEEYKGKIKNKFIIRNLFLMSDSVPETEFGAWYTQDIVFHKMENENEINGLILNKKSSEFEIIPIKFKTYKKKVLQFFEKCDIIGKVMKVHGNIIQKIETEEIDQMLCLSGEFVDELTIDGGTLDKHTNIYYNIDKLFEVREAIKQKKNQEKIEELGFSVDDDVNEFGF